MMGVNNIAAKFRRLLVVLAVIAVAGLATPGEGFAATDVCPAVTDNNQIGSDVSSRQSVFVRDDLDENGNCTLAFVANTSIGNMGTDIGLNRVEVTLNTFDNNSPAGSATGVKIDIDSNYTINSMVVTVGGVSTTVAQNVESFKYNTVTTATSFTAVIQLQRNLTGRIFDFTVSKAANSNTLNSISFVPSGGNPEINVVGNGNTINNGDTSPTVNDHSAFLGVFLDGQTSSRTFTIQNTGLGPLTLGANAVSITGAQQADFPVTAQPATTVASGSSTQFTVQFDPTAIGIRTATININNDDADENPYTFAVRGSGVTTPTFSKSFLTPNIAVGGVSTLRFNISNSSIFGSTTSLAFTDALPAGLVVAAAPNISNNCAGAVTANAGSGSIALSNGTVPAISSCQIEVDVTATTAGTKNNTSSTLTGNHNGNPFTIPAASATLTVTGGPEINVVGNGANSIGNGDTSPNGGDGTLITSAPLANFGSHTQNYTIENLGTGALTLGASAVTLTGSSDFSVEQQPATSVGPSATTTFKIKFTPTSVTQQDATVSIANNDSNEAPYTYAIRAIGTFRPTLDKTFSPSAIIVGGTSTITYTITDPALIFSGVQTDILPAGLVVASPPNTTTTCSNGGFNSPGAGSSTISFNISLDGSCALTIDVTASIPGVFLDPIASTSSPIVDISGATDTLTVVAAAPEINVVGGGNNIGDGDTTPQTVDGTAFSEALVNTTTTTSTFTIQNTGTGTLTLGANAVSITGTHSGDYTVTAQPATTVAAGGNTQFTVQFAPTVVGTRNAIININNDDGDENPYDFAITGEGLPLVTLTKSVSPGTIIAGGTATYTYTYNNPTGALHGGVTNSFTDNLSANLIVATPNNTTSTCFSAGLIALAGASTISTTGVIIGVGGCQLTVDVTSNVPATYIDPVETLGPIIDPASNLSATLTVVAAGPLQASAEFANLVAYREKNQKLTLTLENTTSAAATNVVMTFNLPAGMRKHEASIDSNANCSGGTFTGGQGATSFSYGNGSIPGNSSCIISFEVVSSTTGAKTLSTGPITSNLGVTTAASAQTNIAPLPTHTISYSPATIAVGQVSTLTFSITTYDEDSGNLNDVAVGMELPAGLKVAPTENVGGTCNSQGDTVASDRLSFTLYGATSPQPTCTHSIDIIGEVGGSYTTPSRTIFFGSDITAGITTPSASATLTVAGTPEINVRGNGKTINAGDDSPRDADHTNFVEIFLDGQTSTRTYTIENTGNGLLTLGANAVSTSGDHPTDYVVTTQPDATVTAGSSTQFTVTFAPTATGEKNAVININNNDADENPYSFAVSSTGFPSPEFTKSFLTPSISVGGVSTLRLDVRNPSFRFSILSMSFSDILPAGLVVANPPNRSNTCGGSVTAAPGTGSITISGAHVFGAGLCRLEVDVTATTVGTKVNTTSILTGTQNALPFTSPAASATLTVAATAPVVTTNAATFVTGTGATLNGQVNANGTSTTVTFEYGTTVAYGTSVTADQSPVTGTTNTAVNKAITGLTPNTTYHYRVVGTDGGGTQNGVDRTFTTAPVSGTVTIVHNISGPDINVLYSSPTTGLNFSLTSVSGTAQTTLSNIAVGTHIVTAGDLSASGYGITSIVCDDTDSTGDVASRSATINLAAGEAVTCTFALVETREVTSRQIADYLGARNQLILSHQPNLARRMGRLNDGAGTGEGVASTAAFGLSAQLPFLMDVNLNSNILSYKASARSIANFINSRSDVGLSAPRLGKWDFWSEGQFALFDSNNNQSGQFGIVHVGADYLARPNVLLGVRAQVDWMDQKFADTNAKLSGRGWMVGPYGLVRLNKKFYVDWSAAWGKSANDISPFGTYKDNFDTTRWMVDGALIGEFALTKWIVRPALRLRYMEETQQAYTDSLNVAIPEQRIAQGDIRFGPRFSTSFTLDDGAIFLPWFEFSGGYTINTDGNGSSGSFIDEIEGINGSASAGFDLSLSNGAILTFKGQYEGIGSGAQSYGGAIGFSIPLK